MKIKLRDSQIEFVEKAIQGFIERCPLRFSEPVVVNNILETDPDDFQELIHYIEVNFENELDVQRLKKSIKSDVYK